MAQSIQFAIVANEIKTFEIAGGYFEVVQSNSPVDVTLYSEAGGATDEMKDIDAGTYATVEFKRIQLKSKVPQTVKIFIGDRSMGSRRVAGEVKITNDDEIIKRERVQEANRYYFANVTHEAAATERAGIGLHNHQPSTKKIAVRELLVETSIPVEGRIIVFANKPVGTISKYPFSLPKPFSDTYNAAPTSVGELFVGVDLGLWLGAVYQEYIVKKDSRSIKFDWPILLKPGQSLMFITRDLGAKMVGTFIYDEFAA